MAFSCQVLPAASICCSCAAARRPGSFSGTVDWLKRLFDLGFIGFVVNVSVFLAVSLLTKPLDKRHVAEFQSLMESESASLTPPLPGRRFHRATADSRDCRRRSEGQ